MINLSDPFEAAPTFDDPLGMLRACHRRIERALDVTERIVALEAEGPLDERARLALSRTLHYFRIGVPRHAADEEESLFPRLGSAGEIGGAANTPDYLAAEHEVLDAAHRELDELGQELLANGRFSSGENRGRFGLLVQRLRCIYREHIRVEDDELFPTAAQALDPAALEAIGAEMAARRNIDLEQHRETISRLEAARGKR
jgi:hemerythrin-like domain-containing protein